MPVWQRLFEESFGEKTCCKRPFLLLPTADQAARVVSLGVRSVATCRGAASPAVRAADWQAMLAASRGPG